MSSLTAVTRPGSGLPYCAGVRSAHRSQGEIRMPTLTRRSSRIATAIAIPAAVIAAGVLVSTSSYAAFSDTTANEQNTWRAGSVDLADDATGRALFTVPNAKPGDGGANCIAVTSTGSLASQVRLYAGDPQS